MILNAVPHWNEKKKKTFFLWKYQELSGKEMSKQFVGCVPIRVSNEMSHLSIPLFVGCNSI